MKKDKICFVIMGFGVKKDPETNRTINLDETYKKIIRPAVESCGVKCVRADEITDSGIIDRSMYALLYLADIVIADISTDNPNAVYELGVRHALKQYSTIIIKEGKGKIPFDFGHNRVLNYEHLGNEISSKEVTRCSKALKDLVETILKHPTTDSPLYSYIPQIEKPTLSDEYLAEIIGELTNNENSIYALTERAKKYMSKRKFAEASEVWASLSGKVGNENYYIQQQALCIYKSEQPSKLRALTDASTIISKISETNNTETLGITAAINKRLWEETMDTTYLDKAIELYEKGWNVYQDYYTGENYACCMLQKSKNVMGDESLYYKIGAKKVFEKIIQLITKSFNKDDPEEFKWKYATLSNCYLGNDDLKNAIHYEQLFMKQSPEKWEIDTFNKTKEMLSN